MTTPVTVNMNRSATATPTAGAEKKTTGWASSSDNAHARIPNSFVSVQSVAINAALCGAGDIPDNALGAEQ